ncbi:ankyrin repeat protein [Colletotrichum sojae]|uniref:Ankyrin repeat protein n=1 Tax=Colletotrichum sojae TaxID=2175907 RepID=A0A8H6MTV4_9PEZI|nr:ankyrin repeat protein [Colletotrichum sojae]
MGSYAQDIWDSVLAHCGYQSEEEYARTHRRHAVYTKSCYTRAVFEELWEGMEHLCPYYKDEELGLDEASLASSRSRRRLPKMSRFSEISSEDPETEESCTESSEAELAHHHDEPDVNDRDGKTGESLDGTSTGFADGLEERREQQPLLRTSVENWLSASNTPSNSSAAPVEGYEEPPASFAIWAGGNMPEEVFENPWA